MSTTIRAATADDVDAIGAFQTAAWRDASTGMVRQSYLDSVTSEIRAARWRERLGRRGILVAVDDDATGPARIVGVASWRPEENPVELSTLYVARSHQGHGLGRRLADGALGGAPAHLWVFEANAAAIAFYRHLGFELTGDRTFDDPVGLHEVRMSRPGG